MVRRYNRRNKKRQTKKRNPNNRQQRASNMHLDNVYPTSTRGTELKYIELDLHTTFSSVSTTGTQMELLSTIVQGTQFYQRIGSRIHVQFVQLCYTIVGGQSDLGTDDEYNTVALRLILTPGATTPTIPAVTSCITAQSTKSIRIYFSYEFKMQSYARNDTGYMPAVRHGEHRVPINTSFEWSQDAGDVYPLLRIYLQMITDSAVSSNPGIEVGKVAIFYTDQ